jgi:hypothetical protein
VPRAGAIATQGGPSRFGPRDPDSTGARPGPSRQAAVSGVYGRGVKNGGYLMAGLLVAGLAAAGCGSSGSSTPTTTTAAPSTAAPATTAAPAAVTTTTAVVPTTTPGTTSAATCPTLAQANAALAATYSGPISNSIPGGGLVCEYTGASGNAGVTIFAHTSAAVFAGQVAHAPGNPAMPSISGVGDGAYGQTTGGRSVVNAYSNATRTVVAAQGPGALSTVEALAKVALSDN